MADEKMDLAALRARVDAEEADAEAALTKDESEYAELSARLDAARERKKSKLAQLAMARMIERQEVARNEANSAFVIEILDADEKAPGAGLYLVRSPDRASWNELRNAVERANRDNDKIERAYRNLANKCIVYPRLGADVSGEEMSERYDKYTALATAIGDFAGTLGGVAAGARKR